MGTMHDEIKTGFNVFLRLPFKNVQNRSQEIKSSSYPLVPICCTVSLCFEVPAELKDIFAFRPGQHVTVKLPHGDDDVRRLARAEAGDVRQQRRRVRVG